MPDYEKLYYSLFNAITTALAHMSVHNFGCAEDCLKIAQQQTEDAHINAE